MENPDEAAKSMKEEFVEHPSVFPVDEDTIEDDDDIVLVHNDYAKPIEKENNVAERTNVLENKSENDETNVEEKMEPPIFQNASQAARRPAEQPARQSTRQPARQPARSTESMIGNKIQGQI